MLISAGFLLAAGGLSLAELGTDALGPAPKPAAEDGGASAEGGTSKEADATAGPIGGTQGTIGSPDSANPSGATSPSASRSAKGDEPAQEETEQDSQSATAVPASNPTTADPGPSTPAETPTPSTEPTTSDPTPEPSPSETCERVLWWCS
ncbi:hypothetical protein [Streptomyces blattellae]|uniref:hypothetical protein n=1 Tax=Streptomyces blattellae TaxID=2569855 RepID=UPI001E289A12|nr:hypothetical protein [Streptomyces blattellae]